MLPLRALSACVICTALCACTGPMQMREAQNRAQARMTAYCQGRCGALHITHAQKIKDRWLVDFDAPTRKYIVTVDDGGSTRVDVWDK